jgi:1-acyl-sn-glycerol-3-phosphate acyltransferase
MIFKITMKLQFFLQWITVVLQFFTPLIFFAKSGLTKNCYSFFSVFLPLRARVIFFWLLFFLMTIYSKRTVKTVTNLNKALDMVRIWKSKNCKVGEKRCNALQQKTVKEVWSV